MIGGATTSRRHTAIKIDEQYSGFSVHVTDASRSVGVVGKVLNEDLVEILFRLQKRTTVV